MSQSDSRLMGEDDVLCHSIVAGLGIVAAAVSATSWFWASVIKPSYPTAYLSGAPSDVVERMNRQSLLNAIGAAAAGVTVLCQAALIYLD